MSTQSAPQLVHTLEGTRTDYSLSSLMGLPTHILTFLFFVTLTSFQVINIHIAELLAGDFHVHGDPSILYLAIFLVSATILLVVQHNLQREEVDEVIEIEI